MSRYGYLNIMYIMFGLAPSLQLHSCHLLIQPTDTNGFTKFIVLFQQVSMHHIYNDIFHQAAVSQSLVILG